MSEQRIPIVTLTIALLKEGTKTEDAIERSKGIQIKSFAIVERRKSLGTLYVRQTPAHAPAWVKFLAGHFESKEPELRTASASAVLIAEIDKRAFAVIFGYGRHLLDAGAIEERFGLKVTLNSIDPDRIRAVDSATLEAHPFYGRRQSSRATTFRDFGVNVDQDLLRGTVGEPQNEELGHTMSGADTLTVRIPTALPALKPLLRKYLKKSKERTYRNRGFSWVDHLAEVRDPSQLIDLNTRLVSELQSEDQQHVWAAIPEIVDWSTFDGFRVGSPVSGVSVDDITTDKLLGCLDRRSLSIDLLRRKRVYCMNRENPQPVHDWPFIKCLTAEIPVGADMYLLNAGSWYRIARDFAQRVRDDVSAIPTATLALQTWGNETEAEYNSRMASRSGGALALLDRVLIKSRNMTSPIELCDLMSSDGKLIHIKKYGQSSVLSHLFSQGLVSATTLVADPDFRKAANEVLPVDRRFARPEDDIDRSAIEVCFVIGTRQRGKPRLPFFSQVTLRNVYASLTKAMRIKVSVSFVKVDVLAQVT